MRDIAAEIQRKLREIEEKEQVRILLAVESGSRAWGFASPDSDYDVRFIYVRPKEDYLYLNEPKDVIEWQLDDVFDMNGWDLKKALVQFHKGNVTLFEWSNSPIVYRKTDQWEEIYSVCKGYFSCKAGIGHYYGTAANTFAQYLQGEQIKYKKYFYALRPLLACRYIEQYKCPPPVLFDELLKNAEVPGKLREEMERLLEVKKVTEEGQLNSQMPVITEFIAEELQRQKRRLDEMADDRNTEWDALNHIFAAVIGA